MGNFGSKALGTGSHKAGALDHIAEALEHFDANAPDLGNSAEDYRVDNHDAEGRLETTLAGILVALAQTASWAQNHAVGPPGATLVEKSVVVVGIDAPHPAVPQVCS